MEPSMTYAHVGYEIDGRRAEIRLERPDTLNAVNAELATELRDCIDDVNANDDVDVVKLTGEGDSFCSGFDLNELKDDVDGMTYGNFSRHMDGKHALQELSRAIRRSDTIYVVVAKGHSLGVGFELSLIADICVADEESEFGFPETKVGLSITNGVTQLLPRTVGPQTAKLLTLAGERISGAEASRLGLIADATDSGSLDGRVEEIIDSVLERAPSAVIEMKSLLNAGFEVRYEESLQRELNAGQYLLRTEEYKSSITEFFEE